ncbi:MAG TPA: ATP-binding protein [Terriglobia bacterium]|nr:ATP-binding protein [Terriglobia bacterium]
MLTHGLAAYAKAVGARITRKLSFTLAVAAVLLVTFVFQTISVVNATTVGFAYLITILLVAASWGLSESVVASVTATICFSYFFLPPVGALTIADPENWVALLTFLISSLIASQLSDRAKRRTIEAKTRQVEMERLYALSRSIMMVDPDEPIGNRIAVELARICEIPGVAIYDRNREAVYAGGQEETMQLQTKLKETALTASQWKDEQTGTVFAPISLGGQCIGSVALYGGELSDTALHALLNLIAISLENARSREIATRAQAARQSEEFKSTLLDGLAHEFKTPLTSIKAATSALLASNIWDEGQRQELLTIVDQEAERLSHLVTEATHLARVEAGKIQLHRELHSVHSLVEGALEQMEPRRDERSVQLAILRDLPPILIDLELMQLALRQLIDNAIKYSPQRSAIRVSAELAGGNLLIAVHNWGEVLSKAEQARIFDKFYRGANVRNQVAGTGMGLSIAREILLAHGGDIRLESSADRGTQFLLTMPVETEVFR